MSEVVEAREQLAAIARELGQLSRALADVSRKHEKLLVPFRAFCDDLDLELLTRSEDEDGYRLPSKEMREKLARRKYTARHPEEMGLLMAYEASRERMKQRISDLKHQGEAQRSILSALKAELDALG